MHKIEASIILDEESPLLTTDPNNGIIEVDSRNELAVYILTCSKSLSSISSSMDKARLSIKLLETGHLDSIATEDHSKSDYIEMLIENSIIRVQSIYDRILIFTNRLLDLGISNESINHNLIVTNSNVIKYDLDSKLKSINKACNDYRFIRNTVIHHDRYTEEQLNNLRLTLTADYLSKKTTGKQIVPPETLKTITQAYLDAKKEEFGTYLDTIESKLYELYDTALPIYHHYKSRLRAK
ncbi:hypothetical protein TRE132_21200 [Pseudomonas chlororaphis subsp. aurantiaca]|nr:hypothetical protein TRE132_21200 [Pseudomonas chlororaphis subsp. aurantiaca]